jgi:hypothetical protein
MTAARERYAILNCDNGGGSGGNRPAPYARYLEEYGGLPSVYAQIFSSSCEELQEQFDIAAENNDRETAGTERFRMTLGYMRAADDRMRAQGCYD